jgi:hypothetical protein
MDRVLSDQSINAEKQGPVSSAPRLTCLGCFPSNSHKIVILSGAPPRLIA